MDAVVLKELAEIVSKTAPFLGSVLGGPVGSLAGALVSSVFGAHAGDLIKAISSDPDAGEKLQNIETQHIGFLQSILVMSKPSKIDVHVVIDYGSILNS